VATSPLNAGIPTGPFVDVASGEVTPAWRAFLIALYHRTGGAVGQSSDTTGLQIAIAAERTARSAADQAISDSLNNEAQIRAQADDVLSHHLSSETVNRVAADTMLVPKSQLCSLWAQCDLSFLPTADPGHGAPWLDGNHVAIGSTGLVNISLEDGTGDWSLEALTGHWTWG
jgi:hypothetical protein